MLGRIFEVLKFKAVELTRGGTPCEISFGSIRRCKHRDIVADFFVTAPLDVIQRCHVGGKFYEEEELDIINANFKGGVFVDIGANIGNHAVFIGKRDDCEKIIAFEPNPLAYRNLSVNIALNDLNDKVKLWKIGLSDEASERVMSTEYGNLGGTTLRDNDILPAEFREVGKARVIKGDTVLKDVDVSFIKIDVEGFEYKCLKGIQETIARCKPGMFIEVASENQQAVQQFLDDAGYKVINAFTRYKGMQNIMVVPLGQA